MVKKTLGALLIVAAVGAYAVWYARREQAVPPPPAGDAAVHAALAAVTDDASARKLFGNARARCLVPGAVALPVDFSDRPSRVTWDVKTPFDLRVKPGVRFDFYCSDLSQFRSFTFYFKSGDGWYHGTFAPETNGGWDRVTVLKAECSTEGKPAGWKNVSLVRIAGWRAGTGRATCAVANLAPLGGDPDVLIVYADSLAAKGGPAAKDYVSFGGKVASSIRALGLQDALVADTDLTPDLIDGALALVLPYNPEFPKEKLPILRDFVARGGRLFACYRLPHELEPLLGVRTRGAIRPSEKGGASIGGFLKVGKGLPGQPDYAPQASWITQTLAKDPGVEVVAEWATAKGASLKSPALVRTKNGLFMSHVWLGGTEGASLELMRAILRDLSPRLQAKMAAHAKEAIAARAEMTAWLKSRPSKTGEYRAFWCHSARGLGGDVGWDATIKFLKENGFNSILPNLCWGGVAFYRSRVLPEHADVAARGDALEKCLAACRKYGVECHVWKVCWNMGWMSPASFEKRMVAENRVQVNANGARKSRWLCPSHPENQKLEVEAMVELAKKGVDGVHFDYIRYPDTYTCFCSGCRARFERHLGRPVANWPQDVGRENATDEMKKAWRDFRVANISSVVQKVAERVRRECPGVKISAAVFRNHDSDPYQIGQDWSAWCRAGWLDFVCPMNYENSTAMFRSQVVGQKDVIGDAKLYPGIGLSCFRNDGREPLRLAKQIEIVRELALEGFTVFNLDRHAERALPLLRMGVTRED